MHVLDNLSNAYLGILRVVSSKRKPLCMHIDTRESLAGLVVVNFQLSQCLSGSIRKFVPQLLYLP